MKLKIALLTCVCLMCFVIVQAANNNPDKGKKDDINGSVLHSETKKPLKDVSITAYNASKKEKVILTDNNGNYAFDELKPGTYKFVFEKDGFRKVVREKLIARTDEAFQLNIEMIEAEDFNIMPSPFQFN